MAKCEFCGKDVSFGIKVSHSHRRSNRTWKPNVKRVKAVVPVLIPLFVSSFRRANELEYAMECRCYRGGNGRTKMKVMKMSAMDYVLLILSIIYFFFL